MDPTPLGQEEVVKENCNEQGFICGVIEGFYGKPWTFDQRKDLFEKLKKLKLNAFLYAPKDDTKHRANWRQLYSNQEAQQLKSLISEAQENGVDFYYSLAPGLDMIYSQQSDLDQLIRKYDQLVGLGCKAFAILFDDIEPNLINDKDKEMFKNYAAAQVSISNMIFNHLNKPKFLFCPTEYCESRAVPNVPESEYLNTIGQDLAQGIDFLWSGSRVISRLITEESMETLARVIRRPPIIWENLHANDYDKKRVFLGPYSGRSTNIKSKIRGVMTNPNCEYEANYIAIHTLAQWCYCDKDANLHNICDREQATQQCNNYEDNNNSKQYNSPTKGGTFGESQIGRVYNPREALNIAIKDWLPLLLQTKTLPGGGGVGHSLNNERNDDSASNQLEKEQQKLEQENSNNIIDVDENNVEMLPEETQLSANSIESSNKSEMDTSSSPNYNNNNNNNDIIIETNTCDSCDMPDIEETPVKSPQEVDSKEDDKMVGSKNPLKGVDAINQENLALLVDLFYLPFEHGQHGWNLLKDIKWLRDNSDVVFSSSSETGEVVGDDAGDKQEVQMEDANEREEVVEDIKSLDSWTDRAQKLNNFCSYVHRLVNNLIYQCPNKLLIIELYPYLSDIRDLTTLIIDYIKFLRNRTSGEDRFYYTTNSKPRETQLVVMDEQEPWYHRGGLIGDVQRLISQKT